MIGDLGFDLTEDALGEKGRAEALAGVARCVLSQIERPYPCSERQTLTGPDDLELPRLRFPAFFGSFDWHSCVHSHWTLVRMLATDALAGNAELEAAAAAQLARTFSPDLMEAEAASWRERVPAWEEKPYGWTWELALDVELARLAATPGGAHAADADAWREAARPLTEEMRRRTMGWIAGLSLPSRTGIHSDTGWNLAMAIDCGRAAGDDELTEAAAAAARRLFLADECAPCAYEPQADTFTSSVLNEAALMARVLGCAVPQSIEEKKAMLLSNGVALWDVLDSCDIAGSSDSSIRNAVPVDIALILRAADIRRIYCNGTAAYELFIKHLAPVCGMTPVKLPSTSPANAAWTIDRLYEQWKQILTD